MFCATLLTVHRDFDSVVCSSIYFLPLHNVRPQHRAFIEDLLRTYGLLAVVVAAMAWKAGTTRLGRIFGCYFTTQSFDAFTSGKCVCVRGVIKTIFVLRASTVRCAKLCCKNAIRRSVISGHITSSFASTVVTPSPSISSFVDDCRIRVLFLCISRPRKPW